MKYILLYSLLLFGATTVKGQDFKIWTLDNCIDYALAHNATIMKQDKQNAIYHQNYLEAIGNLLPQIGANSSAAFNFGRVMDDETNSPVDQNSFGNSYSLSTSLKIFDGFSSYARIRIGRLNKAYGKQKMEEVKNILAYETTEAYLKVLYNIDLIEVYNQQYSESKQNLLQVQKMYELGLKSKPDVAEIEVLFAENEYNLSKQQNILKIAIILLKEKMNYPLEDTIKLYSPSFESLIVKIPESPDDVFLSSKQNNPIAHAAESNYKAQQLNYKASKGNLMPSISMNASMSSNFFRFMDGSKYDSFKQQIKNKKTEYVGFTISIPIFSGFSRSANVVRAKNQAYIAKIERDETLRKLYTDITQVLADVNGQVDECKLAEKQEKAAYWAHEANQKKLEQGLIDPILYTTSVNRYQKAQTEHLNSKYTYYLKVKLLDFYRGNSLY